VLRHKRYFEGGVKNLSTSFNVFLQTAQNSDLFNSQTTFLAIPGTFIKVKDIGYSDSLAQTLSSLMMNGTNVEAFFKQSIEKQII
jgi:hypothetical protein